MWVQRAERVKNHQREVLLCKVGSVFARLQQATPEFERHLTKDESKILAELKAHHREHRIEEHLVRIKSATSELAALLKKIDALSEKCSDLHVNAQKDFPELSSKELHNLVSAQRSVIDSEMRILIEREAQLHSKLDYLQSLDTSSDHFLIIGNMRRYLRLV